MVLNGGRWRPVFASLFLFHGSVLSQIAQLINGQQFTQGLSIIDAPAPNSQHNSGGNMPIAIDVSGNGNLDAAGNSRFVSLDIYFVSADVSVNVTVSYDAGLLDSEPGSTVKHLDFNVPECLPAGNYNLTFYESSVFQGANFYTITSVPIKLASKAASGANASFTCITPPPTQPEAQPQAQSPIAFFPFTPDKTYTSQVPEQTAPVPAPPSPAPAPAPTPVAPPGPSGGVPTGGNPDVQT
ncbi:hypothetical protein AURDEDRAFT_130656 [Auricularia subglabra TFB-10046 SS5]|uniref:Phosphatidylglycerol/phosphatidylinositol transfer protein n=1 Tax=Auricularia subglabra (strain TFB-10046 / SS5) TaxID=717982 RepID=J0WT34_AURST|nr:hypothetical protein AURDEDRAFT_130656 [Auricularia subglabra TFB-10046 SS5]